MMNKKKTMDQILKESKVHDMSLTPKYKTFPPFFRGKLKPSGIKFEFVEKLK